MDWFPIFLDLRGANCLVVGSGAVARRKAEQLLAARACVTVVSPELHPEFAEFAAGREITHVTSLFEPEMLDDCELVIAATDSPEVNRQVSTEARRRHLLVNVVDEPALCKFIMPAIVDRSPVVVAISTTGCAPMLACRLKARIEALLPRNLAALVDLAGKLRKQVRMRIPDPEARRRLWEHVFDGSMIERLDPGNAAQAREMLEALINDGAARALGRDSRW